jgi:hypothetical protein
MDKACSSTDGNKKLYRIFTRKHLGRWPFLRPMEDRDGEGRMISKQISEKKL